ncbi:MAG TPA: hypothetical protein VGP65_18070 [Candidatus Angelobacter sp.]|jgi:hypothetical protein|nr:hypothetical protein [Candidatus Angelobacter sp.]
MASKALARGNKYPVAALLLVSSFPIISPVHARAQGKSSPKSQSTACSAVDLNYDLATDALAIKEFDADVSLPEPHADRDEKGEGISPAARAGLLGGAGGGSVELFGGREIDLALSRLGARLLDPVG